MPRPKKCTRECSATLPHPFEVLLAANMLKRGLSKADICEALYFSKDKAKQLKTARLLVQWIKEYPKVFGSTAK